MGEITGGNGGGNGGEKHRGNRERKCRREKPHTPKFTFLFYTAQTQALQLSCSSSTQWVICDNSAPTLSSSHTLELFVGLPVRFHCKHQLCPAPQLWQCLSCLSRALGMGNQLKTAQINGGAVLKCKTSHAPAGLPWHCQVCSPVWPSPRALIFSGQFNCRITEAQPRPAELSLYSFSAQH